MPVCSSGISREKAGFATSIVVDQAYVQSLLPAGLAWLYPYLPWMQGLQIGDVGAFCSVDPPTWTVPTGQQIFDFITNGPLANANLVQTFIQDITRAYLWYSLCECASVTTPAAPSPPSAPSGLPAVNPNGVVSPPVAPCATYHFSGIETDNTLPPHSPFIPIGAATSVQIDAVFSPPLTTNGSWGFGVYFQNSAGAQIGAGVGVFTNHTSSTTTNLVTVPSGAVTYQFFWGGSAAVAPYINWDITAVVNCGTPGGGGGAGGQTCISCPPDPILTATLMNMAATIQLIQRQIAPFAYVSGPVHSGLSGTGTISVQGIIGVLLNVSIPARAGLVAGTPETAWDVGWINFGTADGYEERRLIRSDSQLVFPPVAGAWTIIGYTLLTGVTMTLIELLREP